MTLHPGIRVAFLVTTEEEEAENFMTAKLFTLLLHDKKTQQHPENQDVLDERDKCITQKLPSDKLDNMRSVSLLTFNLRIQKCETLAKQIQNIIAGVVVKAQNRFVCGRRKHQIQSGTFRCSMCVFKCF